MIHSLSPFEDLREDCVYQVERVFYEGLYLVKTGLILVSLSFVLM